MSLALIPPGNALFEREVLSYEDVNILSNNLEAQSFTGVLQLHGGTDGVFFFSNGKFLRAMEAEEELRLRVVGRSRLVNRIKGEVLASAYVLSPASVNVLSLCFAFQPLYRGMEVRKKELKMIRNQLESDEQTGLLEFQLGGGVRYLLLDHGRFVFDSFANAYGDILCGLEGVTRLVEQINTEGAVLSVYSEKAAEIERQRRMVEEELEKVKVLTVRTESGFGGMFAKEDTIKVDEYIVREWGLTTMPFDVELEMPDASVFVTHCVAAKKLGSYLTMSVKLMKKLGLADGDPISVGPVR